MSDETLEPRRSEDGPEAVTLGICPTSGDPFYCSCPIEYDQPCPEVGKAYVALDAVVAIAASMQEDEPVGSDRQLAVSEFLGQVEVIARA